MKTLSTVALLSGAFLLSGCLSAVVVGSAAVATTTVTDPRTAGRQMDDGTMEVRVSGVLNKDPQLKKQARIVATAYQGKILLTGQAPTAMLADRAKQLAMSVDGTTEIYNEIRKGTPVNFSTLSSDIWITTKVHSRLLAGDSVKLSHVKVVTENAEVFLLGLVTEKEGKSAAQIASKVRGVKRVTTAFGYIK